ncbi:hypothetical protein [Streptomyces sp. enrichment culture]|uniref:hypothetical protein n=1 Tax=Streptomyces sp. enrichment culture TaxID=1795815 RepID=UPI003F548A96
MDAGLALLALCTGSGLGFLYLAVRAVAGAVGLAVRGERAMGFVTARSGTSRRRGELVLFFDHFGRELVLDPGRCGPFYGVPPVGGTVPVVYARGHPGRARLGTLRHLLAPSFGWFLVSALVFGTGAVTLR